MPLTCHETGAAADSVQGRPVRDLLLLVGDAERGLKNEAIELLLNQGLPDNYHVLEAAVRDDDDADLRNGAMEVLVRFGKESVPWLAALLRDQDAQIRNFAAVMLGDIGSRLGVGALVEALKDPDPNVSHGAAEALGKIGDRAALVPLVELLKGELWVQFAAVAAMGALRDYRAVPHLLQFLDHELLAVPAAEALGKIGDPRALYPLTTILPYVDDTLAEACAKAVVAINRNVTDLLNFRNSLTEYVPPEDLKNLISSRGVDKLKSLVRRSQDSESVQAAVSLLGWLGEVSAIDDFLPLVAEKRHQAVVESAILSMGAAAEARLVAALADGSEEIRILALRSLRWLGVRCAADDLRSFLADASLAVRLEALETLKAFPQEGVLPLVFAVVEGGCDESSQSACQVLGRFPLAGVRDFFWRLAASSDPVLRRRCAFLLGQLPACGGRDGIEALFKDEDAGVRREVIRAIGMQQVREAIPLLRKALSDPEEVVRETAVIAAADFGEPVLLQEVLALLGRGDESLDYAVIRAVGMMGAVGAGAPLVEFLGRGNVSRQLGYALIETLGKIGYKEASDLICSSFLHHPDPDFRRVAVEALGNLGDQRSLVGVEKAASDPHWSVRIAALHVLGKIGGSVEVPLLVEAMQDQDAMVRKHAIITLGEVGNVSTVPLLVEQLTDMELSRHAFEALLKFGRTALPWLHRLIKKEYVVELRERIIDLIGKIGDRKSVEPLLELMTDPIPSIRLATIDALSYCYDTLPLKKLIQVKNGDGNAEVRDRAALALRAMLMEKHA